MFYFVNFFALHLCSCIFGEVSIFLFKRLLKNKFVGGLTFAVAVAVAVPALAFAASGTVTANVNVRSGPGANYARLAALPAGVSVGVLSWKLVPDL